MLRRSTLAVSALALVLTLAACSEDSSPSAAELASPSPSPTETPSVPVEPPAARFPTYVALGDSFTAAPLISEPVDHNGCLRSARNYPALVAETLGAELEDRSCTGADTSNLTGPQATLTGEVPAQLDALRDTTSLVTIGIGGNDFGLFSTLVGCLDAGQDDPAGSPCQDRLGADGVAELNERVDQIATRVRRVVGEVRRRAPEAEVVLVGYPQIVPPDRTCPDQLPAAAGDHEFLAALNTRLDQSVRRAARSTGATFVDVHRASDEHDICAADPWVNGGESLTGTALAYHPLAAEQEAVAELVVAALRG